MSLHPMVRTLLAWSRASGGQGLVEYALILVLVALVVIAALTWSGNSFSGVLARVGGSVDGAVSGSQTISGPANAEACKNDGWRSFTSPAFNNQGDCIVFANGH